MKITSHKWLTCFFRRGREGRVTEYFLIHNLFVLPLFLSQSYFNCRQRPQRNIIFYDKTLLYIKKMDQTLSCKNVLFHGICGYYLKKKKSVLWHNSNLESEKKPLSWFCIRAETRRHPSNTVVAQSQSLDPGWALQWEPADKYVQAWQRCGSRLQDLEAEIK